MSSTKKGIGYSELTEKIYLGRQNKEKGEWIGDKEDVTNDFINVMFSYVPVDTVRAINTGKELNMFLNVLHNKESIEKTIKYLAKELTKYAK